MFKPIGNIATSLVARASLPSAPRCDANLPVNAGIAQPPVLTDRRCDVDIARRIWANFIPDDGPRCIVRALTDEERKDIAAREGQLRAAIEPYSDLDRDRVAAAVSTMLGGYRSIRQTGADAIAMVDGALLALRKYPAWAIEEGCLAIQRGEVEAIKKEFPPNDPQIVEVVRRIVAPYLKRFDETAAMLTAPIEEPRPIEPQQIAGPAKPQPDGKHGARVKADIEARHAQREQAGDQLAKAG